MTTKPYRPGIPPEILALSHERDILRKRGRYDRADMLKRQIEEAGYAIHDNPHGAHLVILPSIEVDGNLYRMAREMPSFLDEPDSCTFSVNVLAQNNVEQVRTCIESVLRFAGTTALEIILVDNASQDELSIWAGTLRAYEERLHVVQASRKMGEAEARNLGLKQSKGRYVLLLDARVELTGDLFTPLAQTLRDDRVGIAGLHGLRTDDLRHFEENTQLQQTPVEAVDGLCMAFRRKRLKQAGLFDEHYRYPAYMHIDFSFAMRAGGIQTMAVPDLPVTCHAALSDANLSDAERTRLTKRNFYRFLEKWGDRDDLLLEVADSGRSAAG